MMKTAQELRAGQVIMVATEPMVILKAEFNKSGRNSAVVKMKMKNLLGSLGKKITLHKIQNMRILFILMTILCIILIGIMGG